MNSQNRLYRQSFIWKMLYFVSALVVNILYARYLQASVSGAMLYMANVLAFVQLVCGFSFESGLTWCVSKKNIPQNSLNGFALAWVLLIAIILFSLSPVLLPLLDTKGTGLSVWQSGLCGVGYVCGLLLINYFSQMFFAKGIFALPNILLIIINFIVILIIPWQKKYDGTNSNMVALFFFYTLVQGILIALFFLVTQKEHKIFSFPKMPEIKELVRFSTIAFAGNIFFFLTCRLDFYFVEKYCSNAELGNYIQVSRLGQMLLFVPQVLATVIFPQTAKDENDKREIAAQVLSLGRLFVLLYILLVFVLLVSGDWIFPFVFGETYSLMNKIFLIFIPGFCALSCLALISAWFLGKGFLKINVIGALLALLTLTIADTFLVKQYGIYAAAIVSSFAYIVNVVYAGFMFSKTLDIPLSDFVRFGMKDIYLLKNIVKAKS